MAEYSTDDAQTARFIVNQLLSPERPTLDVPGDLVVADLEKDALDFAGDLRFLDDMDLDVPAIRVADSPVPVSLALLFGDEWPRNITSWRERWWGHPLMYEFAREYSRSFQKNLLGSVFETLPRGEAHSIFATRATDFLATRMAGIRSLRYQEADRSNLRTATVSAVEPSEHDEEPARRTPLLLNLIQRLGGGRTTTPGCQFTVTTNSPGLRVFWSGAYWISQNYFSHPTTPTSSVLQSGTFVFGVDGGAYGNAIQWDQNAVVSLPGQPTVHLNY